MNAKKYEVVISGMGGAFPGCEDIDELESKLFNKGEMVAEHQPWNSELVEVPRILGKLKHPVSLDKYFFGMYTQLYNISDPITIQSLKYSFEAICDAGVNPFSLNGSNTAVVMAAEISETEIKRLLTTKFSRLAMVGQSRTMQANRISYFLNLRGPSIALRDNWAGGMQALLEAEQLISSGQCNAAIVGAGNLMYRPEISYHFHAMGKLNRDGKTKCFSADADGYTRSEGCIVLFLQRAEDAKHYYGTIVNVLTCNYGVRTTSYPEFSPEEYKDLLMRVYKEAQIDPSEVCYIEADGSASKKMDALELNCISEVMCANRTSPLAVGSVKSNVGHTEGASSLMSIVKVLMAFKSGFIPPNLHYSSPNPDVPALLSGRMEVVTEPTPLNGNIVGVSSIGLSGSYGHVIIKQNSKLISNVKQTPSTNMPWLFIISGRNKNLLRNVVERVKAMPFNEKFIRLIHGIFKSPIRGHYFRAYSLLNTTNKQEHEIEPYYVRERRPVWFFFSGMGSQWPGMGADLMRLPTFARAINNCHEVLLSKGINLLEIINSTDPHIYDSMLNSAIAITAIQIGLVDVLKEFGVEPDGIIGHSLGEVGCAYVDGCFTAEQTILNSYSRGKASVDAPVIKGLMVSIGLGYNQVKDQLPPTIDVACHNSDTNCTLAGPAEDIEQYVNELKEKGTYAKIVSSSNIAFHSRYIKSAAPLLLRDLKQIIPEPKQRTKRWISSSVPESSWDSDLAKFNSPEYHTNNLLNSVLFEEASAHIPDEAIVIEIAPHGLFQAIFRRSTSRCIYIPLLNKLVTDNLVYLFKAIGKLYLKGISINIDNFYPEIEFPLSGSMPSLGPLLTWNEERLSMGTVVEKLPVYHAEEYLETTDRRLEKYYGHHIHGKQMIPFSLLLHTVIDKFYKLKGLTATRNSILIENLFFKEQLEVLDNLNSEIKLQILRGSGRFEVDVNSQIIAFGQINYLESYNDICLDFMENKFEQPVVVMKNEDIYKFFDEYSVKFNDNFKLIQKVWFSKTEIFAVIHWKGEWIEFLDAILLVISLYETMKRNEFQIVYFIRQLCLNTAHFDAINFREMTVSYNSIAQELRCQGLKLHLPLTRHVNIKPVSPELNRQCFHLQPYHASSDGESYCGHIDDCFQIIFQNILQYKDKPKKLTVVLFDDDGDDMYNNLLNCTEQVDIITWPTEDTLDELYQNLNKTVNLLLFGAHPIGTAAVNLLEKVAAGFVLLKDQPETAKLNNFYPVFKFKFNDMKLTLYKVYCQEKLAINKIIKVDINDKWKSYLKLSLKNMKNEALENKMSQIIYLVGNEKSLFNIDGIVRYCLSLENSHLIRFIFLDDKSPPFSLNQPFYKKQLAKALVMNICVNRTWGCLKKTTPTIKTSPVTIHSQQQSIYSITSIKGENVKLNALGLNLMDITENPKGKKLGVFDYCGFDKAGNVIFGIGTLSDNKKLIEDKILQWQKPHYWSYVDIVSIPLCYSIAYYILRKKDLSPVIKYTMLVHRGGLLVSQAMIRVALSRGYEVFTTYTTVEEKHLIHELFPQIEDSNVYLCKSNRFEKRLLIKTNNKGVDIIVNTSDDPSVMTSSLVCLKRRGQLHLLNSSVMNQENTIGMLAFFKDIRVNGVPTDILLQLSPHLKEMIQKELEDGIKEDHVKPLRSVILTTEEFNLDAINILNSNEGYSNKIVAIMDCNKNESLHKKLFLCSGQKCQIVIGNGGNFWLDLLNWLLCRGARNIYVFTELKSQRLMSILNNYPSANIRLHPKKNCSKTLMANINSKQEISEIYCIGKMPEEEINNLDIILTDINRNTRLVCIGNGGEAVCELRNKNNMPGVAISCELQLMKGSIILPELDRIINYCIGDSVIILREGAGSKKMECEKLVNCHGRLPDGITELLSLHKKLTPRACFIETMTMCASFKYNREVDPVFVIPSLKPNEMDKLTSRLFYPTFEARLPQDVNDIDIIAKDLFEDMKRFKLNIFTIIANEWGGAVGLNLAKYLESSGKLVLLILLNSSPNSIRSWASAVLQMGDDNLIHKYINLPFKVGQKLSLLTDWDEKLEFALQNSIEEEPVREKIRKSINILRKCLLSSIKYNISNELLQGKCIVYRTKDLTQDDNIKECCKMPPVIITANSSDHQDMLEDIEFAYKINSQIPYEYKC